MLISLETKFEVCKFVKFVDFYFLKVEFEFGDPTCAMSYTVPINQAIISCHTESVISQFE